jgi:hypothetical protein
VIVGGYTLHLYCDAPGHVRQAHAGGPDAESCAETGARCRAMARKAGWKLDRKAGRAICPKCRRRARG